MGSVMRVGSLAAALMEKFVIEGGVPLSGTVVPAGNKNAALPLLACALLTDEQVTLHNVPRIRDTEALLDLLADLGVTVERPAPNTVVLCAANVHKTDVDSDLAERIRASFLAAGPLLARFGKATMPPPGGDVIGRRRLDPHLDAFRALGATVEHGTRHRDHRARRRPAPVRLLHGRAVRDGHGERADGRGRRRGHDDHPQRRLRAARAGRRADAQQDGRGDRGHRLQRDDRARRRHARRLRVHGLPRPHRDRLVHGAGGRDRRRAADHGLRGRGPADDPDGLPPPRAWTPGWRRTAPASSAAARRCASQRDAGDYQSKVEDGPWPAFPADLTSIAVALATQSEGSVLIFEKMFENRLFFVDKLISMGAEITICDPHRAIVIGPRQLRGARVSSPDIRAGMAMLIAAVCAQGHERDPQRARHRPRLRADRRAPAGAGRADRARRGVIHPIPIAGRATSCPDELRELRAITDGMRAVFDARGYGEVATPALEYEEVLTRGDSAAADPAYRLFDEHGNVLVLRSDMTIPIARVVATRYPSAPVPLRFFYLQHAYRAVRQHRGQPREILQAGIELVGAPGPDGTAEAVSVLCAALDAAGLTAYRVGLGDASLFARALERAGRAGGRAAADPARARHARPRRARARAARRRARGELLDIARTRGGRRGARRRPGGRAAAGALRQPGRRTSRARDLRPRPRAHARLLHGRGVRGLRRRVRLPARRRRALRRPARALRARAARLRLGARRRARARGAAGGGRDVRIAVPRGAMFKETLDAARHARHRHAPRSAPTTASCSSRTPGIITMRPSDVPTYVEAGAADLGITGKDVLAEQGERGVYELLDLGFGAVPDGLRDGRRARTPRPRRCAGWATMRIATKYSRIAGRYFERTGRQVEIVEVKGSVELAPLTGMVHGIVDLTATGTTLRENGLVIREEIMASTARLIANPVSYRVKAAEIDAVVERLRAALRTRPGVAAEIRAAVPPGASVADGGRRRSSPPCAHGGDAALERATRRVTCGERAATRARGSPTTLLDAALDVARRPTCARGLEVAIANVRAVAEAGLDEDRAVTLPEGQTVALREVPVRRAAVYAPSGRHPYPSTVVMGAITARAAGVDEVYVADRAAPDDPRRGAAVRGRRRLRDHRRAGDRRARLRHGVDPARRRDRRPGQPVGAGGQAAGVAASSASTASPGPSDLTVIATEGADVEALALDLRGPGRARRGLADRRGQRRPGDPRRPRGGREGARRRHGGRAGVRRGARARAPAARGRRPPRRSRRACARAGCLFVGNAAGTAFGDYVAGSNHTLPTEGAARFASGLNVRHFRRRMAEVRLNDAAPALAAAGVPIAQAEGFPAHAASMAAASESMTVTRTAQLTRKTGETDVSLTLGLSGSGAGTRNTGVGFFDHMLDLLARHGRLDLDVQVTGDLQTGSHHTVEDTGIVLGQALDQALGDRRGIVRYGHAVVPMDEARAACAIDISGRPYALISGLRAASRGPHQRLRVRGRGGVLPRRRQRRAADAAHRPAGGHERAPHDRGVLQGASPARCASAVSIDPDETGVPSTKGTLT